MVWWIKALLVALGGGLVSAGIARQARAAVPGGGLPSGGAPLILLGSTGPWVKVWQGILGIPQSGTFDAATDAATRGWQAEHKLSPVDGKVGPATWGKAGIAAASSHGGGGGGGSHTPPSPAGTPPAPTTGNPFGLDSTIAARESQILAHVQNGGAEHEWFPLKYEINGHYVSVLVSRRALRLQDGAGNHLTVNASMETAQKIADMIGGALLTTRIADEIHKHAAYAVLPGGVPPSQRWQGPGTDETGSTTKRMYDQSNFLDKYVSGRDGLISNEGKDWVITRRYWGTNEGGVNPTNAGPGVTGSKHNHANFGWYPGGSKSPGGASVIQPIGLAHGPGFTDYSQLLRFVRKDSLVIDGVSWDWGAALADPSVSSFIQDEGGTIPSPRHPDT